MRKLVTDNHNKASASGNGSEIGVGFPLPSTQWGGGVWAVYVGVNACKWVQMGIHPCRYGCKCVYFV